MSTNSFSRLGTANSYDNTVHNLSVRQSSLANLQENLTSGKRVVRASDDPTNASQAERALTRISRIATDQRALDSQRNAIAVAESTLGDVNDALQTFRELVVSAGNGTHTAADRKTIALQLSGLRDQIFGLANRSDTNGQPLFNALGSALAPFVGPSALAQDYTFNGLPGQSVSSEVGIPFALDGESAFMLEPIRDKAYNLSVGPTPPNPLLSTDSVVATDTTLITGSSYTISNIAIVAGTGPAVGTNSASYTITETLADGTVVAPSTTGTGPSYPATSTKIPITLPGLTFNISGTPGAGDSITIDPSVSLFSVLDDAIRDIGTASSNAAASQAVSQALHNIDIGSDRVAAVRGQAGELLNRADRIGSDQEKRSIQNESDRSRAEDLDMVKGISDFQKQQTGYQAALQSYAQVQKLSLFNYIS